MARIEVVGLSIQLIERGDHLGDVVAQPRRAHQGLGGRLGQPIGVAVFPDQARVLAILAGDIADQNRARQEPSVLIDRHQLVPAQPLAARHAGHGGEQDLEELDVRIGLQEGVRFQRMGDGVVLRRHGCSFRVPRRPASGRNGPA